jgi:hypothetical protein
MIQGTPMSAKKVAEVFFTKADELLFQENVSQLVPDLLLLDDDVWKDGHPVCRKTVVDCRSDIIFLWSPTACPCLPSKTFANGVTRGPTSGVVIQWVRGTEKRRFLTSGDISIGYNKDNAHIANFASKVWGVLDGMSSGQLVLFDPHTGKSQTKRIKTYVIGPDAYNRAQKGLLLKNNATDVFYRPYGYDA